MKEIITAGLRICASKNNVRVRAVPNTTRAQRLPSNTMHRVHATGWVAQVYLAAPARSASALAAGWRAERLPSCRCAAMCLHQFTELFSIFGIQGSLEEQ